MCIIADLEQESLSMSNISRYIDDYSIYSRYIGQEFELNTRYSSPIREGDDIPSFCLYRTKNKIKFRDFAVADLTGDIFDFVRILIGGRNFKSISLQQVLRQIDSDFQLGLYIDSGELPKLQLRKMEDIPSKDKFQINITSYQPFKKEFSDYWESKYDILQPTRDLYHCTHIQVIHYTSLTDKHTFQQYPKGLCIGYQIGGRYKTYFPFESKDKKFRNDFPTNWVFGYLQLKKEKDFCIITKAEKEVMFFRQHFDWDTVAGKSETTKIPKHLMDKLFQDYKKVYIWLDKDTAGILAQAGYIEKYPNLIPITYPDYITEKDPTDRYELLKQAGMQQIALNEIKQLINRV
jgi:hypothetical protein